MNDFEVFIHFLKRLTEFPVVKVILGVFIWLLKILFGSVFRPVYGVVFFFWLVDTGTGYYHARANPDIRPQSRNFFHGLFKFWVYYLLLSAAYQIGRCEIELLLSIQTVIEAAIILTEFKSILENCKKISALKGKKFPLLDSLLRLFEGKISSLMDSTSNSKEEVE